MFERLFRRGTSKSVPPSPADAGPHGALPVATDPLAPLRASLDRGDLAAFDAHEAQLVARGLRTADFLALRGRGALDRGDFALARQHLREALRLDARHAEALAQSAAVEMSTGEPERALALAIAARSQGCDHTWLLRLIGTVHFNAGRPGEALAAFRAALAERPDDVATLSSLCRVELATGEWTQAAGSATAWCACAPDSADGWASLALARFGQGDLAASEAAFERAEQADPGDLSVLRDRAACRIYAGRVAEAQSLLEHALRIAGGEPLLQVALANCRLILEGSSPAGWAAYESRLALDPALHAPRRPRWDGRPLERGARLLLYSEQGLGDVLMFLRFVPAACDRAGRVLLQVPPSIGPLAQASAQAFGWPGTEVLVASTRPEPEDHPYDVELPILSLVHALGGHPEPNRAPYLQPSPQAVARWRELLPEVAGRRRIGIAWAGNPRRPLIEDELRSIPPEQLDVLAAYEGIDIVSLQLDGRPRYVDDPPIALLAFGDRLRSFDDTAALMQRLDHVIAIDTAVAHLAGALAVPCSVLLSRFADWRWTLGGREQPWYGSCRTVRVAQEGQWRAALQRAIDESRR